MKNYEKDTIPSYLKYLDANNLYECAMSQKLPVNGFKWVEKSIFNEDFVKKYDRNSNTGYFLEVDVEYRKTLFNSQKIYHFCQKKNQKSRKTYLQYRRQRKKCCSYKSLKTSTKSWFKIKKGTQTNSVIKVKRYTISFRT